MYKCLEMYTFSNYFECHIYFRFVGTDLTAPEIGSALAATIDSLPELKELV